MATLFDPVRVGALELPNRVVMAPLTRNRADPDTLAPKAMHVEYYRQRASAGLIVTEATQISPEGQGYMDTPGIHSAEQVAAWRDVTRAVHAAGGRIVLQLWHVGRISHVDLQPGGRPPVAPSAIAARTKTVLRTGFVPTSTPRALETDEIARVVADYARAAGNAREAGFDGVEVHGANGYLIDQFLRTGSNQRTDRYGGSVENRTRFLSEVLDAVVAVIGADRTGLRLSPWNEGNGAGPDADPAETFGRAIDIAASHRLAYLHLVEGQTGGARADTADIEALRARFAGVYMANNAYTPGSAAQAVASGAADLVAFGKPFISNPDLVERLRAGAPLAEADPTTFYGGDARGYTDYPTMAEEQRRAA